MNIVFTGLPLAGKGTQAKILGRKLNLPVFSIGSLLRTHAKAGYKKYAMKGNNLPVSLKFDLLKEKLDSAKNGFILENFPAAADDLEVFIDYLTAHNLRIDRVFNIVISEQEAKKRMLARGRMDDVAEIVGKRIAIQGKDRKPVLEYFRKKGVLVDVHGEGKIEEINERIMKNLPL